MFKNAKIGDKVWSIKFGWGTIVQITERTGCSIEVDFKDYCRSWYRTDGRTASENVHPTIFWKQFTIPDEAFKKPLPKLEVDTKVLVWYSNSCSISDKQRAHFHSFTKDEKIRVYQDGRTSFTTAKWLPSDKPCLQTFDCYEVYDGE